MSALPAWHAGYVGIPFVEHGRDRAGCDCWGLVRLILAEQAGLVLPCHGAVYGSTGEADVIAAAIAAGTEQEEWLPVSEGSERALDAVLMKGYAPDPETGLLRAHDMHAGVVAAPGVLIHVERGIDAALGFYRRDPVLKRRVRRFFRHRELADR